MTEAQGLHVPPPKLPTSKGKINKFGERIAAGDLTAEDGFMRAELTRFYEELRAHMVTAVEEVLTAAQLPCQFEITGRAKSWKTIEPKLRDGFRLASIRDMVGVRVALSEPAGREEQDLVVRTLQDAFEHAEHFDVHGTIDRRAEPASGYRAVHLEVRADGVPCEIQIRTPMQHAWAEVSEAFADKVGRELRYGREPEVFTRVDQSIWTLIQAVGATIDGHEQVEAKLAQVRRGGLLRTPLVAFRVAFVARRHRQTLNKILQRLGELIDSM